jgi:hypothetical protein
MAVMQGKRIGDAIAIKFESIYLLFLKRGRLVVRGVNLIHQTQVETGIPTDEPSNTI